MKAGKNSRKNHPPAGAAQRFHTASQPPQSSQRAAEAAKRPPQPHFGSCRSHLTPAWLSDYNLLQYEISLRGGDGARTSLGSVPNFFCPAPAMRAPNSFDATPSFIGPAQTCSRAAPISLCQTPTSLGAAPTSPRDAKISLREAISSSEGGRRVEGGRRGGEGGRQKGRVRPGEGKGGDRRGGDRRGGKGKMGGRE